MGGLCACNLALSPGFSCCPILEAGVRSHIENRRFPHPLRRPPATPDKVDLVEPFADGFFNPHTVYRKLRSAGPYFGAAGGLGPLAPSFFF